MFDFCDLVEWRKIYEAGVSGKIERTKLGSERMKGVEKGIRETAKMKAVLTFRKKTASDEVIQLAVSCMISSAPFPASTPISSAICVATAKHASRRRASCTAISRRYRLITKTKSSIDQRRTCSAS